MTDIDLKKTMNTLIKFRNLLDKREYELVEVENAICRGERIAHFSTNNIDELMKNLFLEARILKTIIVELEKIQKHKTEILSNNSKDESHIIRFLKLYAKSIDEHLENYQKYLKEVVRVYVKLKQNKDNMTKELMEQLMLQSHNAKKLINL